MEIKISQLLKTLRMVVMLVVMVTDGATGTKVTQFITPGRCNPRSAIEGTYVGLFTLSTTTEMGKPDCIKKCIDDQTCRSLTMYGKTPAVQCKLFSQTTNAYGLYLTPEPMSFYYEKRDIAGLPPKEKCTRPSEDPGGFCDKRSSVLYPGESLMPDEYLCSPNGQHYLKLQAKDGNIVFYPTSTPEANHVRATDVYDGNRPNEFHLKFTADGLLVRSDVNGPAGWSSTNLDNKVPAYAKLEDDNNLVVYAVNGDVIWAYV